MKLLLPVILDVENIEDETIILDQNALFSITEAVRNALKDAQANGFHHRESKRLAILVEEVGTALPFSKEGPAVVQHEFDTEPTMVGPIEDEKDEETIILGPELPHGLRLTLAPLLAGILNANSQLYNEDSCLVAEKGGYKCELEWIGEGRSGDFDEEDPQDEKILRFTISQKQDDEWDTCPNGSFCTNLSLPRPKADVLLAAKMILHLVILHRESMKQICEELSHANWDWLEACRKKGQALTPTQLEEAKS
jgi:hypothetical protein